MAVRGRQSTVKLLHIMADSDPRGGGVVEGVTRLTQALAKLGHDQAWCTLDHPADAWVHSAPVALHALGDRHTSTAGLFGRAWRWLRPLPAADRWLARNVARFDGVVVHGLWNASTRCARRALVGSGVPYVVYPHGMLDPWFRRRYPVKDLAKRILWRLNEGPLMREATGAAFTTQAECDLAQATWRPWGVTEQVVGFGTSPPPARSATFDEAFRTTVPKLGARKYLLFLSRLHEKKGVDLLVDAFERAASELDGQLVIAGPGEAGFVAELERRVEQSPRADCIHLTGMLEGDAKWGALYGCEALVLPSHQENFGVVVAEAAGCGRPVIVSDQVNIAANVAETKAGLVCACTVASVERALSDFAGLSITERESMSQAGHRLFESEFSIDRAARNLVAIFANKSP